MGIDSRHVNRFNEHVVRHRDAGHTFELTNTISIKQPGHRLFKCSCGWAGWLSPEKLKTLGWTNGQGISPSPN